MYSIVKNLTSINYNPRGTDPSWIVIHNTANGTSKAGTAYNNTQYFKNQNRGASAHYFIDDEPSTIYQCVEDLNTAWHCGDNKSKNGCTNSNSIAIEVCETGNGKFTRIEIDKLIYLVQLLMNKYNIPPDRVCRHKDVTGKICPYYYASNEQAWQELHNTITKGIVEAKPIGYEWVWYDDHKKWAVKHNGSWVYDEWVQDDYKWYRIDSQGWLLNIGWYQEGDFWYYLDKSTGKMITGWFWDEINKAWYFLDNEGRLVQNGWHYNEDTEGWYYLKSDGRMATKEYVHAPHEVSRYWTNENGKWEP